MAKFVYRLETVLEQKKELRDRAQEELTQAIAEQKREEEILDQLRNKERALRDNKAELKAQLLSGQRTAEALRNRRNYLKRLDEELEAAGAEVFGQRILVDELLEKTDMARLRLADAIKEAEALEKHRERQYAEFRAEIERKEALELDEAATQSYLRARRNDAS